MDNLQTRSWLESQLLSRTKEERRYFITLLEQSLNGEVQSPNKAYFDNLASAMARAMGEPMVLLESRTVRWVWARAILSHYLRDQGYTLCQIGEMLGKDHSSIVHSINKMEDALKTHGMFGDIKLLYNEFLKELKNNEQVSN